MYLLDTNVLSELRRIKPHGAVLAWLKSVPNQHLFTCAVCIGELQAGVELTRRQDSEKAELIESWINQIVATFNIVPVDALAFRLWAQLIDGHSDTLDFDALIAAVAKVRGMTVVTRNVNDFKQFDVRLYNPFEFKS